MIQEQDYLHLLGPRGYPYSRKSISMPAFCSVNVSLTHKSQLSMLYASTKEVLKNALNVALAFHADDKGDIEWKTILAEVSKGKGQ